MIYFTADQHFGHKNIIRYSKRPFENVLEMESGLIENWNNVVSDLDKVYFLGDFALLSNAKVRDILSKLNGYKIMIMGNHDRRRTKTKWHRMGFDIVYDTPVLLDGRYLLSHHPMHGLPFFNIYAHVHSYGKNEPGTGRYCVSVELNEYKPVSFEHIKRYEAATAPTPE